ncbi:MarR family transcriptional regulator [Paenibacillus antibioticophila]|uniref:MarR family transcriptional regulator n=1 Tax=Paenibacillus antibioticophila TaxID=1274374 RepID=A0A919XX39_9BACL|nr:MarR family winged helix-turn-helix transcriptional regulator [Paenibacillus antibioticophila]GIO40066.1 MarR family transcriptional regulator [Paenibacillus antibioticophila]
MNSIGKLISYSNRIYQKHLSKRLKQINFGSGAHQSYLILVLKRPGLTQEQLTSEVKFDKATTARSVKQLEEAGYIERRVDEKDRRSYRLYPTARAREIEPEMYKVLADLNEHLTRHLTPEEREQLSALLEKLYEGIKEESE